MVGPRTTAEAVRRDANIRPSSVKALARDLPKRAGARSNGGKARPSGCPRALLSCGFVSRIVIISSPTIDRKSGC